MVTGMYIRKVPIPKQLKLKGNSINPHLFRTFTSLQYSFILKRYQIAKVSSNVDKVGEKNTQNFICLKKRIYNIM